MRFFAFNFVRKIQIFATIILIVLIINTLNYLDQSQLKEYNNLKLKKLKSIQVKNWIIISKQLEGNNANNINFQSFVTLTVSNASSNRLHFWDTHIERQLGLNLKSKKTKNDGYLFAIKNGAQVIYDSESLPRFNLLDYFIYETSDYGLIYDYRVKSRWVINPLAHFGQPMLIQHGNPFRNETHKNSYFVGKRKTSVVQHAILDKRLDKTAPSFQLPIGKMGIFDSKTTLFRYEAFWALYLPETAPSEIFRSLWSQRLMWLVNQTLTFIGPKSLSVDIDKIDYNLDYSKIKQLIDFLYNWRCNKVIFYDCILDLSDKMAINGYWDTNEVKSIQTWLNDLKQLGYKFPKMMSDSSKPNEIYNNSDLYSKVRFTPNIQRRSEFRNNRSQDFRTKSETHRYLKEFCEASNYTLTNISRFRRHPYEYKSKYILLITFNDEIFEKNIPLLVNIYRGYFQAILFCGKKLIKVLSERRGKDREIFDLYTFIEYDTHFGYFHYNCMNKAIEMGYEDTEGILLSSDDVIIKPWNLRRLDSSKIWFSHQLEPKFELKVKIEGMNWAWWPGSAPHLIDLFNYTRSNPQEPIIGEFLSNIERHRVNNSIIGVSGSDIFYLPKNKFKMFHFVAGLFVKFEIFLEIAVPTILIGLDSGFDAIIMNGVYVWGAEFYLDQYEQFEHFAHPYKMSQLRGQSEGVRFCRLYIQEKINQNF